jgi:peptidoglycan/xylan/chitin deacetylase (PgdA/CDA1 family)
MPGAEVATPNGTGATPPGTFVLSLDFELLWGTLDLFGPDRFRRACTIEREIVVDRLLALFETYQVPATWCVLGHLFLGSCRRENGVAHPRIVRPQHRWVRGEWFQHDPCSDEARAPLFYGRSLVEKVLACRVPHEIGAHSFSHVIYSDPGCSREAAASDLAACVEAARELGLTLRSFVFPRNGVGHLDLLPQLSFSAYRGMAARWYERSEPPSALHRLARLWSVVTAAAPPLATIEESLPELTNVPASMIYLPRHGIRCAIPVSRRVQRARKGLLAAARTGGVFHLWLHPTNLADGVEAMFEGFEAILVTARELVRSGRLRVATMGDLACRRP